MLRKQGAWLSALITTALAFASSLAGAQSPDYPVMGGSNGRVNHNGTPNTSGPSYAHLGWYAADGLTSKSSVFVVDNTDFPNTLVAPFVGGPYDTNFRGSANSSPTVSATNDPAVGWAYPAQAEEAAGSWVPVRRALAIGTRPADYRARFPSYFYTNCTPSAIGNDPTVAKTPSDLRYFEWKYKPTAGVPPYVQIEINLPVGPTLRNVSSYLYSQRYYVYEVDYTDGFGVAQRAVYTVDSYSAAGGWYRLGGQDAIFPVTSTNGVTVRLYNTVPRDPSTGLLLEQFNGQTLSTSQEDLVKQRLVYADAVRYGPSLGSIYGTPTSATLANGDIRVTMATNEKSLGVINGISTAFTKGVVLNYKYNNTFSGVMQPYGIYQWRYSPLEQSAQAVNMDNPAANITSGFVTETGPASFQGADYAAAPVKLTLPYDQTATYAPNLVNGTYQIYAFIPGNVTGQSFATSVRYDIYEGNTVSTVFVDQSKASGWLQLGSRRFTNLPTGSGPLKVVVTNYSSNGADTGKFVYTDTIRFVGASDLSVVASPIHAKALIALTPGGTPTATDVVVVADENGVIHCLDATGNANGTTTEYWSYPSTPDTTNANWTDPNLDQTSDAYPISGGVYDGAHHVLLAEMPTAFGMSSGIVQRINGADYLYVTTQNGRVYCIAMAGRGDFNATLQHAGTTQRVWTYPATYPSPITVSTSSLGAFVGSPAFAQLSSGQNALFVPTMQGRMYALNALPTNSGATFATTTPIWTYPTLSSPALGPIATTPAVDKFSGGNDNLHLFFGTEIVNDNPGAFFALNANNGNVLWSLIGVTDPSIGANVPFDSFDSSPVSVSKAILDASPTEVASPIANTDTVYALNQDRYMYAFDANTGAVQWQSNELEVGATGALSYVVLTTYDLNGVPFPFPAITVPAGSTQNFYAMFARTEETNVVGGRLAWEFGYAGSTTTSSLSNSNNWMYGADNAGYLYAFDQIQGSGGQGPGGGEGITPNNPLYQQWLTAKVRFISETEFKALADANATPSYAAGTPPSGADTRPSPTRFDYGETAYLEVYDFPYATTNTKGNAVVPPQVNFTVSSEGQGSQLKVKTSQQFASGAPTTPKGVLLDGYAVYAIPFSIGINSVPPGGGVITVSITSSAMNGVGAMNQIALNPAFAPSPITTSLTTGWSRLAFTMANPLGIAIPDPVTGIVGQSLGATWDPANPQNGFNGSKNASGGVIPRWDLLQATPAGPVAHGQSGTSRVYVYDRSLLTMLLGEGLPGVFVNRNDFAWQGDEQNVYSRLDSTLYPKFEDLPGQSPNLSLDYPNLTRDRLSVVANPTTNAQNPLTFAAKLNPPMYTDNSGNLVPITFGSNIDLSYRAAHERLIPTIFDFKVAVPKYQPANLASVDGLISDENGLTTRPQGYTGRVNVFANISGNGNTNQFVLNGNARSTYRGFNLSIGVNPDWKVAVTTPNVDLGSLSAGTALVPGTVSSQGNVGPANPWAPNTYFQPFTVTNEGNVNLLDLRIAKSSSIAGTIAPWAIFSSNNDAQGFLDGSLDVWSNMDADHAPVLPTSTNFNRVMLQKARVTDLVPTELSVNPIARANPNTGLAADTPLIPGTVTVNPNIGVTVPIGLPTGTYSQIMRVIDNDPSQPNNPSFANERLDQIGTNTLEAYSDPSFTLSFNVRETRLTSSSDNANTYPMVESLGLNGALGYSSVQPSAMRDPNGGLITAWVSDRSSQTPGAVRNPSWRIFLAGLGNQTNFANSSFTTPAVPQGFTQGNPLQDLDFFHPDSAGRWFTPSNSSSQGYPNLSTAATTSLFGVEATNQSIFNVSFGAPSFPADGEVDRLNNNALFTNALMAFVGEAQVNNGSSQSQVAVDSTTRTRSRVFIAQVGTSAHSGVVTASDPILVATDDTVRKGKPAIIQRGASNALVFFPGVSGNTSKIYYSLVAPGVNPNSYALDFGTGFTSLDSVSALERLYTATSPPIPMVELTFTGKLRGEPNDEVFFGRLHLSNNGTHLDSDATTGLPIGFVSLPAQTFETISASGATGTYRARGVDWDPSTTIHLVQVTNSGAVVNLLLDGYGDPNFASPTGPWPAVKDPTTDSRVVDRESGIISYNTRLGGKVYIDPALGTVKFVGGIPSNAVTLRLSYQPRFLRISNSGVGGYSSPSGLFDSRVTSDPMELNNGTNAASFSWRKADNANGSLGDTWSTNPGTITNDRYVFTYNQAAPGGKQAARPFMSTQRIGLQLLYPIYVDQNGVPGYVFVQWFIPGTGWTSTSDPYEIDPANGRIYVEKYREDWQMKVVYQAADPKGNALTNGTTIVPPLTQIGSSSFIAETDESPIPIENAINETGLNTFLDPFSYSNQRRPPLMWLFWTSTRNGIPDVYFQTLAPNLLPHPKGSN